jgi:hypothetical protein
MKKPASGFGLVEWMVATAVGLLVVATLLGFVRLSGEMVGAAGSSADVDERLRILADRLAREVALAGAGSAAGPDAGALGERVPAVFPHRRGVRDRDPELSAFDDRLTLLSVAPGAASTRLASDVGGPGAPIDLAAGPGCPSRPACGLAVGDAALLADDTGRFDLFFVRAIAGSTVTAYAPAALAHTYAASEPSLVAGATITALMFDAGARQVRLYQGNSAGLPLADGVRSMSVRYLGDPAPPRSPRPGPGRSSCVVDAAGTPLLPALAPTEGVLVELTPAVLSDGPVCGEAPQRFDADLLRLRSVRFTIHLDPIEPAPGTRTVRVAARQVSFDVALRNLPR